MFYNFNFDNSCSFENLMSHFSKKDSIKKTSKFIISVAFIIFIGLSIKSYS